jgi:hypothetical protein
MAGQPWPSPSFKPLRSPPEAIPSPDPEADQPNSNTHRDATTGCRLCSRPETHGPSPAMRPPNGSEGTFNLGQRVDPWASTTTPYLLSATMTPAPSKALPAVAV